MGRNRLVTIFLTLEHSVKAIPNLCLPVLKIGGLYKLQIFDHGYFKHRFEIGKGTGVITTNNLRNMHVENGTTLQ